MFDFQVFRTARERLGFSQMELARQSGVSLPTIQNIEAGKANPSWTTLENLAECLALEIRLETRRPDWAYLAACGVPLLTAESTSPIAFDQHELVRQLVLAAEEITSDPKEKGRKGEALGAFLFAVKHSFPTFYKQHLSPSIGIQECYPNRTTGRIIKLSRIARETISKHL